jgi:glycosyltransferase involved in cell wall biosynthesis
MQNIYAITGNLKQNQTGMATYAFNILSGISNHYEVSQIMDNTGDIQKGCQGINPPTLPIPFNYLSWSIQTSFQKTLFSKSDLIHNMCQYPIFPPRNKKYIITIYDLIPVLYPHLVTPVYAWQSRNLLPKVLKKSERILAISEHTKNDLISRYHVAPEKIDVTHLGVSDHFKPMNEKEICDYKKKQRLTNPYILFVGAIEPKKNITTIINAFSYCIQKMPELILVLAGKPSWKCQEIFSLINSLHLEKKVRLLNFVPYEELPLLYSGAEVFVFPSRYEGFGLPPLEAMKCGTPVIVSNTSSLPEIVGERGIMVDPDDFYGLYEQIIRIIQDLNYRNNMINYYRNRAEQFTWNSCVRKTIQSYEKTLSE